MSSVLLVVLLRDSFDRLGDHDPLVREVLLALEICDKLHFNPFLIEGVPGHEMTGLALNMTHHMNIVNHADVEHISNFVGISNISDDDISEEEAHKQAALSEG